MWNKFVHTFFFSHFDQIPEYGLPPYRVLRSLIGHTTVGRTLLWTSDQPDAETST